MTKMRRCISYIFPKVNSHLLLRLAGIAIISWLFFGYVCRPCFIHGGSMLPAYPEHGFTFCWCPAFWFSALERGDVVVIRFIGRKYLLLKRVVAVEGDSVSFRDGELLVNGKPFTGEWQENGPCDWELSERVVGAGNIYVVGDNRSMPMEEHLFGEVSRSRVLGVPLW